MHLLECRPRRAVARPPAYLRCSPTDIYHVLPEQKLAEIGLVSLEQRQVRGLGPTLGKSGIEPIDIPLGIAARSRDETNPRPRHPSEAKRVIVQPRDIRLHGKATATKCNDLLAYGAS